MFQIRESDDVSVKMNFLELIQILLKDPEERKHFFMVRLYTCSSLKSHKVATLCDKCFHFLLWNLAVFKLLF